MDNFVFGVRFFRLFVTETIIMSLTSWQTGLGQKIFRRLRVHAEIVKVAQGTNLHCILDSGAIEKVIARFGDGPVGEGQFRSKQRNGKKVYRKYQLAPGTIHLM